MKVLDSTFAAGSLTAQSIIYMKLRLMCSKYTMRYGASVLCGVGMCLSCVSCRVLACALA